MADRAPLNAVLFDAGGTLVRLDFEWISEMLGALGSHVPAEALRRAEPLGRRWFDATASRPLRSDDGPHPPLGSIGDIRAYFAGTLEGAGVRHPTLEEAVQRMVERGRPPTYLWGRPMEGARAAIDGVLALGLRAACVSNSDGRAEQHLVDCGVRAGLEFVVDSQLVGLEKPDPRIFALALERLGIPPARALYVGDFRSVDERGSRQAGMHFVLVDASGAYAAPGSPAIAALDDLPRYVDERFATPRPRGAPRSPRVTSAAPSREAAEEDPMKVTEPITVPGELLDPHHAVDEIRIPGVTPWRRGKVRHVYEAGPEHLLIVASDRLSAYDSILPTPIPGKGAILSQLSAFWMRRLASAQPNHLVSDDPAEFPEPFRSHAILLRARGQLVRRAERVDIECVVRGYLTGSAWKEYRADGTVCGLALPAGLADGSRLDAPVFTPATKNDSGHDENISLERLCELVGDSTAAALRARSLALYGEAHAWAWARRLVLADTKFEFGWIDGELTLIDEALSPDSSRYWDRQAYEAGRLLSFDKQFVRDWLDASGWDHEPPAPALPPDVVERTQERYLEALRRLTGGPR